MDYEFKFLVTFCLIENQPQNFQGFEVKIAADPFEISMGDRIARAEQNFGRAEKTFPLFFTSQIHRTGVYTEKNEKITSHGEPGSRRVHKEDTSGGEKKYFMPRAKRRNLLAICQSLLKTETYGHHKWREIRKVLHCFSRVLQSHSGFLENSSGRKVSNEKFTSKSVHPESAAVAILDVRKSNRSKFDGKKSSARRRESLLNASKSNIYRAWNKNWKKVDKYKHKSRRNRLKQKDSDGVPGEVSEENPRCNVKYFCYYGNSSAKYSKFRNDKLIQPNNTVLDPKISLHPSEKAFSVKGKNHPGSFKNRVWQGSGISLGKSNETGVGNRRKSQGADDDVQQESEVEKWKKTTRNLGTEEPEKFNRSTKRPQNTAKSKTWPHFVYHLVSSNLVFPYGKTGSHHPNSYVAISVANDSVKIDSWKNH